MVERQPGGPHAAIYRVTATRSVSRCKPSSQQPEPAFSSKFPASSDFRLIGAVMPLSRFREAVFRVKGPIESASAGLLRMFCLQASRRRTACGHWETPLKEKPYDEAS